MLVKHVVVSRVNYRHSDIFLFDVSPCVPLAAVTAKQ